LAAVPRKSVGSECNQKMHTNAYAAFGSVQLITPISCSSTHLKDMWLGAFRGRKPMDHEAFDEKLNASETPTPTIAILLTSASMIGISLLLVEFLL
jgi:hypothetical protein